MIDHKERIERIERAQFRGRSLSELEPSQRMSLVVKRRRNRILMMILNILLMLFFGYSVYAGMSQLSETWLTTLTVVFSVNIGLYLYQLHQLTELRRFYAQEQE